MATRAAAAAAAAAGAALAAAARRAPADGFILARVGGAAGASVGAAPRAAAAAAARAASSAPAAGAGVAAPPPRQVAAAGSGGGEGGDGPGAKSMFASSTMRVADVLALKGEVYYHTTADALVYDAVVEMVKHNIGSLVVVEPAGGGGGGLKPVGILTERDYLDKVVILGRSSRTTKVAAIMSEKALVAVQGDTTLGDCMDLMVANRVRHIPVVEGEGGLLKGLISIGDVVKELVDSHKRNAESMSEYIQGGW